MNLVYKFLLVWAFRLHRFSYSTISKLVVRIYGVHPKHQIIQYVEWFVSHLQPSDIVLDVGSHHGKMSFALGKKASRVIGVEIVESNYLKAQRNNQSSNVEFILGDITKIDLSTKNVSVVAMSNVLEHIEERVSFLKSLIGSLKNSNPRYLIRVPLISRSWEAQFARDNGFEYRLDPTHYTEYTEQELENELSQAGLEILEFSKKYGEAFLVCQAKRQ